MVVQNSRRRDRGVDFREHEGRPANQQSRLWSFLDLKLRDPTHLADLRRSPAVDFRVRNVLPLPRDDVFGQRQSAWLHPLPEEPQTNDDWLPGFQGSGKPFSRADEQDGRNGSRASD